MTLPDYLTILGYGDDARGPYGAAGPPGIEGPAGPAGPTGPQGPAGSGGGVDDQTPPFDNTGATDISSAMQSWFTTNAGHHPNHLPSGLYKVSTKFPGTGVARSDAWSKLHLRGDGPALTRIINGTLGTMDNQDAMISLLGASYISLKKLILSDLTIGGISTSDVTRLIATDGIDEMTIDNVTLENNAAEGLVSYSGDGQPRRTIITRHRSNDVGGTLGRAAWNVNGDMQILSQGITSGGGAVYESDGAFIIIGDQLVENMTGYGFLVGSTWSGGARPGIAEFDSYGAVIHDGIIRNHGGRGILIPDYTGHDVGATHYRGYLGLLKIHNWIFDKNACAVWGGADAWGSIEFAHNIISGQFDNGLGFGPQSYAVSPQGGYWMIHDNLYQLLPGDTQFSSLMGFQFTSPTGERIRVYNETIRGYPWYGSTIAAFQLYSDSTISGIKFEDDKSGTLTNLVYAMVNPQLLYQVRDYQSGAIVANILGQEFQWQNPNHSFSLGYDQTIVPTLLDTPPAHMTYKPGDRLIAMGTQSWSQKRCNSGGSLMPTPLSSITGTGTNGASTITLNSTTGIFKHAWLAIAGITGPRRVVAWNDTTKVVTLNAALNASVSATTVDYATPTWLTV